MKFELWLTFLVVCTLFSISPGPGAVSSMSNSLSYGFSRGFLNVLGLQCALLVHLTLVGLGLGALVASSEVAFQTLKYLGAGYLISLGYKKWTQEGVLVFGKDESSPDVSARKIFFRGLVVNLTNPKSIVFFGALLPQFLDPASPQGPQFFVLTVSLLVIDTLVMGGYGFLAASLRGFFQNEAKMRLANKVFGGLFTLAGIALATAKRPAS